MLVTLEDIDNIIKNCPKLKNFCTISSAPLHLPSQKEAQTACLPVSFFKFNAGCARKNGQLGRSSVRILTNVPRRRRHKFLPRIPQTVTIFGPARKVSFPSFQPQMISPAHPPKSVFPRVASKNFRKSKLLGGGGE